MELAPGSDVALTVLRDQLLAGAVNLQARGVDTTCTDPPTRACQRRGERQAGAAPRERRVVGHTDIDPEQGGEQAQQAFRGEESPSSADVAA